MARRSPRASPALGLATVRTHHELSPPRGPAGQAGQPGGPVSAVNSPASALTEPAAPRSGQQATTQISRIGQLNRAAGDALTRAYRVEALHAGGG